MGLFDKLFGGGKPSKPKAVVAASGKVICAPVAGRVEATDAMQLA